MTRFKYSDHDFNMMGQNNCAGWFYVDLTQVRVIWEERTLIEKMLPLDWSMGKPMGTFY